MSNVELHYTMLWGAMLIVGMSGMSVLNRYEGWLERRAERMGRGL